MLKIYFISGVNGVGKSSIMPFLSSLLPKAEFEIFDFDQRGVPENAGRDWRISETKYWIGEGKRLAQKKKSTVICGFIKPSDLPEYNLFSQKSPEIVLILLDADSKIIRKRLIKRYTKDGVFDGSQKVIGKSINEFIEGNVWYTIQMKDDFKKHGYSIIDTSALIPEEVAKEVTDLILK